jgi:tetratricopeptide (TPR) repeat protein
VQAAGALARYPVEQLDPEVRRRVERAFEEHVAFLMSRADDPTRHYNLGNFYQDQGRMDLAVKSYECALKLQPDMVPALVNLSMVHARRGDPRRAEDALRQALRADPTSSEANFNMGLLLAEQGRTVEAESCLRAALKKDPKFAEAAFNLAVLLAGEKPLESIELCRKAMELRPDDPRYGYTLAFYLYAEGETPEALQVLQQVLEDHPNHGDSLAFLGRIYEESGRAADALQVYRSALSVTDLPPELRSLFTSRVAAIEGG